MNRASIGATSFAGSEPGFAGKHVGVGREVAMDIGRQFHGELYRLVIGDGAELQLCHFFSLCMVRARGRD